VDAAIAEVQQHGMTLVNSSADHADAPASIYQRMQWLQGAGFDFLSSGEGKPE
jgi:predicted homoserine dehydrogenase-like protein